MTDFWTVHGLIFILFMFFFPRFTMLVATAGGGGFFYWVGWLLAPRLTVAILATHFYGHSNTALVVFTWIWAIAGESTEKQVASKTL